MEGDVDVEEQKELELWEEQAKKKKPKKQMKVSGKSVFKLRDTIKKKAEEQKGGEERADTDTSVDA